MCHFISISDDHWPSSLTRLFLSIGCLFQGILVVFWLTLIGAFRALVPSGILPRKSVRGELILITGAGNGLGRLLAQHFGRLGARLVLWDIDEIGNAETARLLEKEVTAYSTYQVDLSNRQDIERCSELVKSEMGIVDILINNAGIVTGKLFLDCPNDMIERTMAVNANAHFWTTKAFLVDMLSRNHGHIVSVASVAGFIGLNGLADYSASKFAIIGFHESLLLELSASGHSNVHATCICPYFIKTDMFHGVTTGWPKLLPILEPDYAVERIVDAVLTNTPFLIMPRLVYLAYFIKGFLPIDSQVYLGKLLGFTKAMCHFQGRHRV